MAEIYWSRDVSTVTPVHALHTPAVWWLVCCWGESIRNHQTWEGTAMAFTNYAIFWGWLSLVMVGYECWVGWLFLDLVCSCHFVRLGGTLTCHQLDIIKVVVFCCVCLPDPHRVAVADHSATTPRPASASFIASQRWFCFQRTRPGFDLRSSCG